MKMKQLLISLLVFSLFSCNSTTNKTGKEKLSFRSDKLLVSNKTEIVRGHIHKVDSTLNPYMTQFDTKEFKTCNDSISNGSVFNCILSQFPNIKTPIQFGPLPEIDVLGKHTELRDSIFIVRNLQDSTYYLNGPGDRMYSYFKGKIIEKNDNYILCVVLFTFSIGFEYELYSFKPTGQIISKIVVGGQINDEEEIYGFIPNDKSFEIYIDEFEYKNDQPILKPEKHEKYIIEANGQFRLL
jgi:hypothetical protein